MQDVDTNVLLCLRTPSETIVELLIGTEEWMDLFIISPYLIPFETLRRLWLTIDNGAFPTPVISSPSDLILTYLPVLDTLTLNIRTHRYTNCSQS